MRGNLHKVLTTFLKCARSIPQIEYLWHSCRLWYL